MRHFAAAAIQSSGARRALAIAGIFSVLAGCAVATEPARNHAAGSPAKKDAMNSIGLNAWITPQTLTVDQPGVLQVSLHPKMEISKAIISVTSSDPAMTISPARYVLENLAPDQPEKLPALSPPNPPPLGMTVQRNFRVQTSSPGSHRLTVSIDFDGGRQQQEVLVPVRQ